MSYKFGFWIILCFLAGDLDATTRTFSVEELCNGKTFAAVNMNFGNAGILTSVGSRSSGSCEIFLRPKQRDWSIVLSLYSYNLDPEEELIIEDSDNYMVKLLDNGLFYDGRKSFLSDGFMAIIYKWNNNTAFHLDEIKFRLVFTQTHKSPCYFNEFQCRNGRCITNDLVCDYHNNCGDKSDEEKCSGGYPDDHVTDSSYPTESITVTSRTSISAILLVVVSCILAIVIIVLSAILIRRAVQKKKQSQKSTPAAISSTAPGSVAPSDAPGSSYVHQIPSHEAHGSDIRQVPSMYPHIPTAPYVSGIDNPEFKAEE